VSCPLHSDDWSCVGCIKLRVRKLKQENAELKECWNKLKEHINPNTVKPIYWDYTTAQSIAATIKELEANGDNQ